MFLLYYKTSQTWNFLFLGIYMCTFGWVYSFTHLCVNSADTCEVSFTCAGPTPGSQKFRLIRFGVCFCKTSNLVPKTVLQITHHPVRCKFLRERCTKCRGDTEEGAASPGSLGQAADSPIVTWIISGFSLS